MKIPVIILVASSLLTASGQTPAPVEIGSADHPNLQAALDALPATGGVVHLAPGRFELREPLIVRTPETRLEGSGAATHLVNLNEDGKPALHIRSARYADDKSERLWRIQIGNFRISGNPKSGDGVLAEGINELLVHGVSVDHHGAHGVNLVDCYEDPRIADSILTYNTILHNFGVKVGKDSVVKDNIVTGRAAR